MIDNEDIYFDTKSGISVEEQQEILSQINGIAEKNRKSLLEAGTELLDNKTIEAAARKKTIFFPAAVNIAAVLILGIGVLVMVLINARKDFEIREGKGTYTLAEQALIGELTASQEEALLTLQRLSREQERAASIDAYLSGSIGVISELILSDRFDEAAASISELKIFLDTPSFGQNRTFLARKEFYIQSINSLEKLVADIQRSGYSVVMALEEKNAELENTVENLENTIGELSARNTDQADNITQLQETVTEKDTTISSLETEKTALTQTVSDLQTVSAQQQTEINQLTDQLTNLRQALQALVE